MDPSHTIWGRARKAGELVLPIRRIATGSLCTLGAALALTVPACNQHKREARVGDSLLDFVRQEHLEAYPRSNLPREILDRIDEPLFMRSQDFAARDWIPGGPLPADVLEALGPTTRVLLWRLHPQLPRSPDSPPPIVVRDGVPIQQWNPKAGPFPGLSAWYEEATETLLALSEIEPTGLSLEYQVEAWRQLDLCEKLLDGATAGRRRGVAAVPAVDALVQRVELNQTSRRSLLLPAGASLAMPFEAFPADGLRVAVGLIDRSCRFEAEASRPLLVLEHSLSDGAAFSVEVIEGSTVHEVWARQVDHKYIRWGFSQADIDLSQWRGKPITLRLRTDPGPAGDPSFDYAVWSDLTLLSAVPVTPSRPHIVLIDIDTLRADRMSCYGYGRRTTPRIDAWFARSGTRYEDSLAPASWTLPSTASLLTGLAPHQHLAVGLEHTLSVEVRTLAELLRESGYQTLGVVEGPFLGRSYGLDAGFDEHHSSSEVNEEVVAASWQKQLERLKPNPTGRPVFLFLQTYLVHAPYRSDPRFEVAQEYEGKLRGQVVDYSSVIEPYLRGDLELSREDKQHISALYDAGISRMDEVVGNFLETLESTLGTQETLVILTSDHGEELFEHDGMTHCHSLYEELLRVPMLVRFPSGIGPRETVSQAPVSLLDIAPTLLDLAGLQVPNGLPGRSLLSNPPDRRLRVSQTLGLSSVSLDGEKLILGRNSTIRRELGPVEYYRLDEDPGELRNLAAINSHRAERLKRALADYFVTYPGMVQESTRTVIDQEATRELRALGYLGGL